MPHCLLMSLSDIARLAVVGQLSVQVVEGLLLWPVMAGILWSVNIAGEIISVKQFFKIDIYNLSLRMRSSYDGRRSTVERRSVASCTGWPEFNWNIFNSQSDNVFAMNVRMWDIFFINIMWCSDLSSISLTSIIIINQPGCVLIIGRNVNNNSDKTPPGPQSGGGGGGRTWWH